MNKDKTEHQKWIENSLFGDDNTIKLTDVLDLSLFSGRVKEYLSDLYGAKTIKRKMVATIINSIFTHQEHVFMMSKGIFISLINKDPNIVRAGKTGCNWTQYNFVMSSLLNANVLTKIREHGEGVAALYELTGKTYLDVLVMEMNQESMDLKKLKRIDLWEQGKLKIEQMKAEQLAAIEEGNKVEDMLRAEREKKDE